MKMRNKSADEDSRGAIHLLMKTAERSIRWRQEMLLQRLQKLQEMRRIRAHYRQRSMFVLIRGVNPKNLTSFEAHTLPPVAAVADFGTLVWSSGIYSYVISSTRRGSLITTNASINCKTNNGF